MNLQLTLRTLAVVALVVVTMAVILQPSPMASVPMVALGQL